MMILAIDDEPKALRLLHDAIAAAEPNAEIVDFSDGEDALLAIREQHMTPNVVFLDIELPEMSGLAFAVELKKRLCYGLPQIRRRRLYAPCERVYREACLC